MWKCPKCGRTFQRQEQSHYCGKAPDTTPEGACRRESVWSLCWSCIPPAALRTPGRPPVPDTGPHASWKTITRTKYLNRIIDLNQTPDIKIITGIRRSGKSKLMQAYIEYLKNHYENINGILVKKFFLIAGLLIILTVFLKTEWKHMNPDITSGKKPFCG